MKYDIVQEDDNVMNFDMPIQKDNNAMNCDMLVQEENNVMNSHIPIQEDKNTMIFHMDVNALNSHMRLQEDYEAVNFQMQAQEDNILLNLSDLYNNNELPSFDDPEAMKHELHSIQHQYDTTIQPSSPSHQDLHASIHFFNFNGSKLQGEISL